MRYRKDFVTNSSSSSFVCDICGEVAIGMDATARDLGMLECVNGHTFCEGEALPLPDREDMIAEILKNEWNKQRWVSWVGYRDFSEEQVRERSDEEIFEMFYCDEEGFVPERMCPICQFEEYSQGDMVKYLFREYGVSKDEVFAEIKKFNKRRKKLYDIEYITYVCQKFNLNPGEIAAGWKEKFDTYKNFANFLK